MTQLKSSLSVTVFVFTLLLTAWIGNEASRVSVQTQEADRALEIERYPDEPLQLVDLRIGTQSVKDRIKQKFKDNVSKWGTDTVKFKEKDDWFKRVSIKVRNISDKPVIGLDAFLFFKPLGYPMMFSLQLTGSKELRHDPLQPGAEIELSVSQGLLNHTLDDLKQHGTDVSRADISFSLDAVIFSDELQWYRGKLLRPDSATPGKWVPINEPLAMKRNKPSATTASFVRVSFKTAAPVEPAAPFVFATCTTDGGFFGPQCSGDTPGCIRRVDVAGVNPGLLSHVSVSGLCLGSSCQTSTTHTRLQTDPNCQPCPDADHDTFFSNACGGNDCNDSNANINPNASENCNDEVDNDCNGQIDDPEICCGYEGPLWEPGGGMDCHLCSDTEDNDCDDLRDIYDSDCFGWCAGSPVLIDVSGNGFDLTNAANGVSFDLNNNGTKEKLSWTTAQTDDAWLALDRNGDGAITNGTELFGNFTPQPSPPVGIFRNGFNALAEYDQAPKGGNSDGLITEQDSVFDKLWLWRDTNHNGLSEANELSTMKQLGLKAIDCKYKESKRTDQYGNQFRYRAKVTDVHNTQIARWAWDVFLLTEANSNSIVKNIIRSFEDIKGIAFLPHPGR